MQWASNRTRWWNTPNVNQPNPSTRADGTPFIQHVNERRRKTIAQEGEEGLWSGVEGRDGIQMRTSRRFLAFWRPSASGTVRGAVCGERQVPPAPAPRPPAERSKSKKLSISDRRSGMGLKRKGWEREKDREKEGRDDLTGRHFRSGTQIMLT